MLPTTKVRPQATEKFAEPGIESWFTPGRFAALLGLLIALTFIEVVTGQATFFYRDFGVFTYPVAYYQRECFWRGELPLWNPLNNCGIPFLAQWNTSALYPPTLFYLIFPLSWSLGVFGLGHLFFGGMGMYFLARRWTGNPLAASIAGAIFAFNGLSWQLLVWVSNLAAWAWMPWVILTVEKAWNAAGAESQNRGSRRKEAQILVDQGLEPLHVGCYNLVGGRSIALAALAGGMQMLTGSPEIIFLTWCMVGLLWLVEMFRGESPRGALAWRTLGVGLLAGGLAAAQLLPFIDLLRHSNRNANFSDLGWAMPLFGPANFLVPLFRCFESGHGVYPQYQQYWTPSYYAGIGTIAVALVAVWRVRDRRVWLLVAAFVLSVLMALGPAGGLYSAVRSIVPQLGFMRYPIKFVVLAVFALPLLAAYGVNWLLTSSCSSRRKEVLTSSADGSEPPHVGCYEAGTPHPDPLPSEGRGGTESECSTRSLWISGSVVLSLIALILVMDRIFPEQWENRSLILLNSGERATLLILILGALYFLCREREPRRRLLLSFAVVLLFWADIYTHAPKINPTVARSVYEPNFVRGQMKLTSTPQIGEPRFMPTLAADKVASETYLPRAFDEYTCRRLALYQNCNLLDGISKTDGFSSSYLREPDQILSLMRDYDDKGVELKGFKDFLGIEYISAPGAATGGLDWTNRSSFQPLITAGQKPVFADGKTTGEELFSAPFDPRHTVYLPVAAQGIITATNGTPVKISPTQLSAHRVDFETESSAPAMVTIAQAFYHCWHAYVDGRQTTLWPANYAFQALEVPAGRHQVSVIYEDGSFRLGSVISGLCLLGCGLILFWRTK
jgi:hypothetical protein